MTRLPVYAIAMTMFVFTGCNDLIPRDEHPERTPSPAVQVSCYRWNVSGITDVECGMQTGTQPPNEGAQ